jgi:hypothetical protein
MQWDREAPTRSVGVVLSPIVPCTFAARLTHRCLPVHQHWGVRFRLETGDRQSPANGQRVARAGLQLVARRPHPFRHVKQRRRGGLRSSMGEALLSARGTRAHGDSSSAITSSSGDRPRHAASGDHLWTRGVCVAATRTGYTAAGTPRLWTATSAHTTRYGFVESSSNGVTHA